MLYPEFPPIAVAQFAASHADQFVFAIIGDVASAVFFTKFAHRPETGRDVNFQTKFSASKAGK